MFVNQSFRTRNYKEDRKLQIIVTGFKQETDKDEIIKSIEDYLKEGKRRNKVVDVFAFSDPAKYGVIEFESVPAKIGFYKKIRDVSTKIGGDIELRFEDNKTFPERARDKTLGMIKHHVMQHKGLGKKQVKIDWGTGSVKTKEGEVASVTEDGSINIGEGLIEIKKAVEEHMKEWVEKRTTDDDI